MHLCAFSLENRRFGMNRDAPKCDLWSRVRTRTVRAAAQLTRWSRPVRRSLYAYLADALTAKARGDPVLGGLGCRGVNQDDVAALVDEIEAAWNSHDMGRFAA